MIVGSLKDRVVVVTGASGGIGSALCKELSSAGAKLYLTSESTEKLEQLAKELGGDVKYLATDFTSPSGVTNFAKFVLDTTDTVDVLFNVAGIGVYKPLEEVTQKDWDISFAINVTAAYFMTKNIIDALIKAENGVVLNVGSGMAIIPSAGRSVYCATKSALRGLTLSLAEEYEGTVDFIHILLGSTLTGFGPMTLEEKKEENMQGKSYLTPEWVAKKFVEIVTSDQKEKEIQLYPGDYKEVR